MFEQASNLSWKWLCSRQLHQRNRTKNHKEDDKRDCDGPRNCQSKKKSEEDNTSRKEARSWTQKKASATIFAFVKKQK